MHKSIIIILLIFLSIPIVRAQNTVVDRFTRFNRLTVKDGLSHNTVNDIVQDDNGFIWFATENGLSRYDGYSFVNFFHNPESTNSIPGNSVLTLAIDNSNSLWIGTTEGLCQLNLSTGKINRFKTAIGNPNTPRTNHIRKLYFSKITQKLWIETLGGVLTSFDTNTKEWNHFSHESSSQPYYRYHTIFEDKNSYIWVGGRNTPIIRFDQTSETMYAIYSSDVNRGGKRENDLADIFQTSKGEWFVVGLDGIYQFFPEKEQFNKIYSSSSFSIVEDTDGHVWFGSGSGLLKYNPITKVFRAYRNNTNNPFSIVNSHINKVFIDKDENIWAGTRDGVALLSQSSKDFDYYFHIPGDDESLSGNEVTALAEGQDGTLYVGTAHHGLNILKPGEDRFSRIEAKWKSENWLSSERIRSLYFDSKEMLWIGLWSGIGFNQYNPKTKDFKRFAYDRNSFKYDWYNAFLEDSQNNFIAGIWGAKGAMHFDRSKGVFTNKHYITYSKPYSVPIEGIMHDGNGNFFMLSRPYVGNLFHYSTANDTYKSYVQKEHNGAFEKGISPSLPFFFNSLSHMAANGRGLSVFATDKGIFLWTESNGFKTVVNIDINPLDIKIADDNSIYLLQDKSVSAFDLDGTQTFKMEVPQSIVKKIMLLNSDSLLLIGNNELFVGHIEPKVTFSSYRRLPFNMYGQINYVEIFENYLWVSTTTGLLRYPIKQLANPDFSPQSGNLLLDIPVTSTLTVNSDKMLVFSPLGIYVLNQHTGLHELIQFEDVPDGFSTAIQSATLLNNNTIWVGIETGHYQINIDTGSIIDTNLPDSDRLSSHLTSTLMEDASGDIWVGTTNMGLNRINRATGFVKHFYKPEIPSNYINATLEGTDGKIWVATQKGLCYIVDDNVVQVSNIPPQLDIRSLVEDEKGFIWAGTNNGIVVVNPQTYDIKILNEYYGFPVSNFSRAGICLSSGAFALGSSNGFLVFNPATYWSNSAKTSEVTFTHFSLFGKPKNFFLTNADTINLTHTQNFFTLSFSASNYGYGKGPTYYYMLENVDPTWVKSQDNSVSYTNVAPGRYKFLVATISPQGQVLGKTSTLTIFIKPAFWQTLWFKLAIILIVLGGISAYSFTYIRQIKSSQLNVELKQRLLISQMNPHFIFNSLSAIQSFMYRNQPEEAGNYLSSFSRLVRLILENSRSAFITVLQEKQTLELYLELQQLRFPNRFDFSIEFDKQLLEGEYQIPPMLAQPFIENSIEHGIMHKNGFGHIAIEFKLVDNSLLIIVEDDGVGIEKSMAINLNRRLSHKSYATSITRDRIKIYAPKRRNRASVTIINLANENKEGTRVEISLPLDSPHKR